MKNKPTIDSRVTVWGTKAEGVIVFCSDMKKEDSTLYMVRLDKPICYEIGDMRYHSRYVSLELHCLEIL